MRSFIKIGWAVGKLCVEQRNGQIAFINRIHDVALKFHQCRKFIHKIFLYTGWIFGLSSENVESRSRLQRDSIASSSTTSTVLENNNAVQIKMEKLRRELEMLQTKVVEERERQFSNYKVWCYK